MEDCDECEQIVPVKATGKSNTKKLTGTQRASEQFIYPASPAALTELPSPVAAPIPASMLIQCLPHAVGVDRWPSLWPQTLAPVWAHDSKGIPVTFSEDCGG